MPRDEVDHFFDCLPSHVIDPLTGLRPKSETELSAAFVIAQTQQRVRWPDITPATMSPNATDTALRQLLGKPGHTFAEYPLQCRPGISADRWGQMRADALFWPVQNDGVVMFEAKVDSHFTYSDSPPNGQLSRQIEYLQSLALPQKWLVVICPEFNLDWYGTRLLRAWNHFPAKPSVSVCTVTWEAIFASQHGALAT